MNGLAGLLRIVAWGKPVVRPCKLLHARSASRDHKHQRIPRSFLRWDHGLDIENLGSAVELLAQMLDAPPIEG